MVATTTDSASGNIESLEVDSDRADTVYDHRFETRELEDHALD